MLDAAQISDVLVGLLHKTSPRFAWRGGRASKLKIFCSAYWSLMRPHTGNQNAGKRGIELSLKTHQAAKKRRLHQMPVAKTPIMANEAGSGITFIASGELVLDAP